MARKPATRRVVAALTDLSDPTSPTLIIAHLRRHEGESHSQRDTASDGLLICGMGRGPMTNFRGPTRKPKDHHVLLAVAYEDGRSAYIRVAPTIAENGDLRAVARECQERRELPDGTITGVKRVR
jgi:hypothetical protein